MANMIWKMVKPKVIGPPEQLLQNKCFDSIIPYMRTSKIQNDHQWASKWMTGSERDVSLGFWAFPVNLPKINLFIGGFVEVDGNDENSRPTLQNTIPPHPEAREGVFQTNARERAICVG